MAKRTCYYYDPITSIYSGTGTVTPANSGDFILPDNATWEAAPDTTLAELAVWDGGSWTVIAVEPDEPVDTPEEAVRRLRLMAFIEEADGLFFGWQRGENTEAEWLDAVESIRARYPYPTE